MTGANDAPVFLETDLNIQKNGAVLGSVAIEDRAHAREELTHPLLVGRMRPHSA
ncbi:MAG: hypothetical protein AB8B85_18945 [Paracoccaceae bacterium]